MPLNQMTFAGATTPIACPICSGADVSYNSSSRDRRKGLPGSWSFWECARCAVLFQHPMPTFEVLQSYYAGYSTANDIAPALSRGSRYGRLRWWFHRLTGDVDPRDFVPAARGARILDYGCGAAPYLGYFHSKGARISGAEIAPSVVKAYQSAGFDVALIHGIEHIPFPDEEFDIVYMMQVIEHIARPHAFLGEVRRVLKPAGELYLAMPNARSIWRKVFARHWVTGWFAPFHVFVYGITGIQALAQARGFEVVCSWTSTSDSWLRLNLKAWLYPNNDRLDLNAQTWLDATPFRVPLLLLLRCAELFIRERDCLVVKLKKA